MRLYFLLDALAVVQIKAGKTGRNQDIDWDRIEKIVRRRFSISRFRPGQCDLIECALTGKDALGILPTGGGKSLCFHLPSLLLPGLTVVVSPLIALMQDQEEKAENAGIESARMDSTLSSSEEDDVREAIEEGQAQIVYVTPERLENSDYLEVLKQSNVSLFVVDEAHCVSQWGHDFRPAYLSLRDAAAKLGRPPILALTATATDEVADDIISQLGLRHPVIVRQGVERRNLLFRVYSTVNEAAKQQRTMEILEQQPGSGIIYCATIRTAEILQRWLSQQGVNAALYHGKLKTSEREEIQRRFMDNQYKVIVATKAFGLGIDKPDVRFVIHYQFPDSIESYYQEAGRAGRDGKPAVAALLYQLEDKRIQSYFLGGKYPSRHDAWRVYELFAGADDSGLTLQMIGDATGIARNKVKVIAAYLEGAGVLHKGKRLKKIRNFEGAEELEQFLSEYQDRHASDQERLHQMMHYGQTLECRVRCIKQYFGEESEVNCGRCDNCLGAPEDVLRGIA